MSRFLRYHPLFDCDVRAAVRWYNRCASGLGEMFKSQVKQTVQRVQADPESYSQLTPRCRYLELKKFPYILVFDVTADALLILAVLHTAQSPEKWQDRLDE